MFMLLMTLLLVLNFRGLHNIVLKEIDLKYAIKNINCCSPWIQKKIIKIILDFHKNVLDCQKSTLNIVKVITTIDLQLSFFFQRQMINNWGSSNNAFSKARQPAAKQNTKLLNDDQKSKSKNCISSSCLEQLQSFMYLYFKDWLLRIFLNVFQKKTEKREISFSSATLGVFIDVPKCFLVKIFSSLLGKKYRNSKEKNPLS